MSHSQSEIRAISTRYVTALFAMTEDKAAQDQLCNDLGAFATVIESNNELSRTLSSPVYSRASKIAVVEALLKSMKANDTLTNFVLRVAKNDRLICLPMIATLYKQRVLKLRGIVSVEVTSAQTLSDAQTKSIVAAVEKSTKATVQATFTQNTDLLGGIIIRQGSQLLDFSLRGKLQRLGTSLKANVVHG